MRRVARYQKLGVESRNPETSRSTINLRIAKHDDDSSAVEYSPHAPSVQVTAQQLIEHGLKTLTTSSSRDRYLPNPILKPPLTPGYTRRGLPYPPPSILNSSEP